MTNQKDFLGKLNEVIANQLPDIQSKVVELMEEIYKNSPNILICGKSGVGKSTLINNIFREEIAKTGVGTSITKEIKKYKKDNVPVNIYDTPGFDLGDTHVQENVIKHIQDCNKDENPQNHIHVMWYCISGSGARIEDSEIDFIKEVKDKTNLCVIILLTKIDQDLELSEELYVVIKNKNLNVSNVLQISAKTYTNLKDLITITNQILPEAFRRAFMNAQIVNIEEKEKAAYKYMMAYVTGTALVSFTPIPFSDWVAIVPMQLTMLIHISVIFGLEIDKAIVQSILTGSFASSGATILGRFLGSLAKLIPGIGTVVGGSINAAIASSITTAIGGAYIKLLSKLMKSKINGEEISTDEMEATIKSELEKSE